MAIHISSQFDYQCLVRRDRDGVWRGRAAANAERGMEYLAGDAPEVELAGGTLWFIRTQHGGGKWMLPNTRADQMTRGARVALSIGHALEAVLEDQDELLLDRGPTADMAIVASCAHHLVIALGAAQGLIRDPGVTIETDPRAHDVDFYYMADCLDRPDARLVWLDPGSPNLEMQITELDRIPPEVSMVMFVVRCDDRETGAALHRRIMAPERHGGRSSYSRSFHRVGERFKTREDWIAHLKQLPKTRPTDLFLRFTVDGKQYEVTEGDYQFHDPWHLFVRKVYTPGIPGEMSQIGLARAHPALTAEMLIESVEQLARGGMQWAPP